MPNLTLNDLLVENARLAGAPGITPPRERTGSTDFGNVMYRASGQLYPIKSVPRARPPIPKTMWEAGKTEAAPQLRGLRGQGHGGRIPGIC